MDEKQDIIQIDVEKIIRNQENKTVRNLPRWVIKFIKWLIKEDEMNRVLRETGHLKNFEFISAIIKELDLKIEVYGEENIPKDSNVIFVGNHALGGDDFLALMHVIMQHYSSVNHLTNDVLLAIEPLKELMVPVKIFGKNPPQYVKMYDEKLEDSTRPVTIFPSGEVARMVDGKWDDGVWRSGFVRFAKKYNKMVIPFFISTKNSPWFYRIGKWRKKLGIQANLELFLLPRQLFYHRGKTIKIIFGKPIPPEKFDDSHNIHEWAEIVKREVYKLGELNKDD